MNNPVGIPKRSQNPATVIMPAKSVKQIRNAKAASTKHITPRIFKADLKMIFDGLFMPPLYASSPTPPN